MWPKDTIFRNNRPLLGQNGTVELNLFPGGISLSVSLSLSLSLSIEHGRKIHGNFLALLTVW